MRALLRGLFAFEALITLGSAIQGFASPGSFAGMFVARFHAGPQLAFIGWLAACYVVIATLELSLLRWGDAKAWRVALPAILIGDVLHVLAHAHMISEGGLVGAPTYASFGFTAVFATARLVALKTPSLVAAESAAP